MQVVAAPSPEPAVVAELAERPVLDGVVVARPLPAHVVDVAEDVQRPHVGGGAGDAGEGLVEVVAPDAHVAVSALRLDAVIPDVANLVAVEVGVGVGEAG
ncbi:MAG: hypothetical protein ACYC8T_18705, partial [Myxococcaceae bacterium]